VREHRERFRRDLFPELDRANSYYSMAGRWPDVGWLLLDRASYNQINPYATNLQLVIQDFVNPALTVSGLTVVQARCVTRGLAADLSAIYLLEVTNSEGVIYNPWFQYPTSSQYNIRAPAYDGGFYSGTVGGAGPWTWDGMVGDLWGQAASILGTYPHLPIAPTSTPEGFAFVGVPLWEAINSLMDYLGLAISGTNAAPTITVSGAADAAYTALATRCLPAMEDSMEYLDAGSGRVPRAVVVYFHRRNQYYGTEETVRDDAQQWQNVPYYSVTVPAPTQFAGASGTAYLWADYTMRYDMDGNPIASDVATAATVAQERVTQFFNKIYRGTQGFMRHVYAGVLPFVTGSLVDGVRWYCTDGYAGWRTEVIRGFIWNEVTFPLTLKGLTGPD
jgi:hypothetical protein